MEVGLGPSYFVFDGDPAPPEKGHSPPTQFLAHVYCGQTAGWMKTPLGTEVDLGQGHIVLGGDPAPRTAKVAQQPPLFGPCLLWPRSAISATVELLYINVMAAWLKACFNISSCDCPKRELTAMSFIRVRHEKL